MNGSPKDILRAKGMPTMGASDPLEEAFAYRGRIVLGLDHRAISNGDNMKLLTTLPDSGKAANKNICPGHIKVHPFSKNG